MSLRSLLVLEFLSDVAQNAAALQKVRQREEFYGEISKMKRFAIGFVVAFMGFAQVAWAGTMDAVLANGLKIESASMSYTVTFNEDGTYTTDVGIEGTWELNDGELCTTRSTGEPNCQPLLEGKGSGDSWEGENAAGEAVTVTIL